MRALIVAALVAAALPWAQASAQTSPAAQMPAPEPIAENFLAALKRNDVEGGLKAVGVASPMLGVRIGDGTQLKSQIRTALEIYGPILGWERIESMALGNMVRRDTYLVQHRDMVTRWRFVYVRAAKGWTLGSFIFDDQVPAWFEPPTPSAAAN